MEIKLERIEKNERTNERATEWKRLFWVAYYFRVSCFVFIVCVYGYDSVAGTLSCTHSTVCKWINETFSCWNVVCRERELERMWMGACVRLVYLIFFSVLFIHSSCLSLSAFWFLIFMCVCRMCVCKYVSSIRPRTHDELRNAWMCWTAPFRTWIIVCEHFFFVSKSNNNRITAKRQRHIMYIELLKIWTCLSTFFPYFYTISSWCGVWRIDTFTKRNLFRSL